jgi:hypothetical protein
MVTMLCRVVPRAPARLGPLSVETVPGDQFAFDLDFGGQDLAAETAWLSEQA